MAGKQDDRNLGMDHSISYRDLLLGMGAAAASAFMQPYLMISLSRALIVPVLFQFVGL